MINTNLYYRMIVAIWIFFLCSTYREISIDMDAAQLNLLDVLNPCERLHFSENSNEDKNGEMMRKLLNLRRMDIASNSGRSGHSSSSFYHSASSSAQQTIGNANPRPYSSSSSNNQLVSSNAYTTTKLPPATHHHTGVITSNSGGNGNGLSHSQSIPLSPLQQIQQYQQQKSTARSSGSSSSVSNGKPSTTYVSSYWTSSALPVPAIAPVPASLPVPLPAPLSTFHRPHSSTL